MKWNLGNGSKGLKVLHFAFESTLVLRVRHGREDWIGDPAEGANE